MHVCSGEMFKLRTLRWQDARPRRGGCCAPSRVAPEASSAADTITVAWLMEFFYNRMERCRRMAMKQVSCAVCRPKSESHRGRCAPGKMRPKCAHDQPGSWSCHETESNRLLASFSGTRSRYAIAAVVLDGACCRRPAPPVLHTETKKQLRGLGATVVGSMTELNRPHHVPNVTCSPNTPMELC